MIKHRRQFEIAWLVALVLSAPSVAPAAARGAHWDSEPYRIHLSVAIDAPGQLAEKLTAELPAHLDERVHGSIGPPWRLSTDVAGGTLRRKVLHRIDALSDSDVAEDAPAEDKHIFVAVEATPWGYQLSAREFDRFTQQWGTTQHATTRQLDALPEQLFALVERAVTPLAKLQVLRDDPKLMAMSMRASALPPKSADFQGAKPGDVFLPLLRRTTREGELAEGGIQIVPWTYLEVVPAGEAKGTDELGNRPQVVGRVQSGMRSPLSGRRRARTEQVAIALRPDDRELVVRLRSRTDADKPLPGYEVQTQDIGDEDFRTIGLTDDEGEIRIAPGKKSIQLLFVKSGGILLARVPIVPGLGGEVEIPLPDDEVRLQAAARLASLREDLVDLVARRNIYMARVRQQIEEKNYDRARELLESLDELPGPTQFNSLLEREARLHRTNDPQVQRRIDQLFAATQVVLGQFLDPRPVGELHEELRQAQGSGS